jgi:broad specificity phosphatase PhoE
LLYCDCVMIPLKDFYMIRHGETEANAAKIMAGSLDSPLNQNGRDQAKAVQAVVRALPVKPSVIVHSQLSRARETAEIINEALKLPLYEDPDLAELHAGDWEGVSYDQCRPLLDGWDDPPGGERFEDFFARVRRAKKKALEGHEGRVLIVSHGGVFRAFAKLYGLNIWGARNCTLHEFLPTPQNQSFPWTAHIYEYENGLKKTLSDSFHAPVEIAS